MGIFKRSNISREDIFLIFAACVFPVFLWSFYNLFNQMPNLLLRLNIPELIGVAAYILGFALLESCLFFIVLFATLFLLALVLPRKLLGDHLVAISSLLALLISGLAMVFQLSLNRIFLISTKRSVVFVGVILLGFLGYYFIVLRFPKFENAVRSLLRRLSVLSGLYALLGILSILVILIRNL